MPELDPALYTYAEPSNLWCLQLRKVAPLVTACAVVVPLTVAPVAVVVDTNLT